MINAQDRDALCQLIRAALFGQPFDSPVSDWKEVYRELIDQAMIAIPTPLISEELLGGDEALAKEWHIKASRHILIFHKRLAQQDRLLDLMKENHIPIAIIKGAAAAMYYPHPELRQMGDIDFMVPSEDFERVRHILPENGYVPEYPEGPLLQHEGHLPHHLAFFKENATYELHRYPSGVLRGAEGEYLRSFFYEGMKHIREVPIGEYAVPVLPDVQNGMALLLHIVHHLTGGLGLRQITDWMMYVDRCLDDPFWEKEFRPVAEAAGLSTLAKTVTGLCQRHLGLRTDGITWCRDADDDVCDELLDYFMDQGNFGRRVGDEQDRSARLLSSVRNPIQFFRLLQRRGFVCWEAVRRHPNLKYVAWLHQLFADIKTVFTRKGTLKKWTKAVSTGTERGKLFDALAIYKK